ncbi:PTS sugar transporter subunit IIA [Oenococcus sicerae]|uniref:PTS sugar transporter subunit IIA n=1 Tax=Oenococcus sicerae TaxID=2203724 RepID=A0AAJ1RDT1_9LACO|nr:PTS sugar transporter subunit IIA [Oenococcus sicerae]MDN6900912.1 PTS sugar transporter subunit IIA [Oenococcus sicerae]QAS69187.1 PTS sugar transporter subunit IIA [Oenococcus sicerae]
MIDLYFRQVSIANTQSDRDRVIAKMTSDLFAISEQKALFGLISRRAKGPVEVAKRFDLPHVEFSGIDKQGLLLIDFASDDLKNRHYWSLVIVADQNNPNSQLVKILKKLLQETNIEKLRRVDSEQLFKKISLEHDGNVIR